MKPKTLLFASLLLAGSAAAAETMDAKAAFDRLKSLAGEWQADTSMGKSRITYQLIAGGTALVERESIGGIHEMMTVYHLADGRLLLTHYCMAGNQPRMEARRYDPSAGEIAFEFLDGAGPASGHMHNAQMRLVDADHLGATWDYYEGGRLKNREKFAYIRVK